MRPRTLPRGSEIGGADGAAEALSQRDVAAEHADVRAFAEACRIAEALLFASSEPLSAEAIASRLPGSVAAMPVIRSLQREYAARGVNLVELAGKWAFRTADDLGYLALARDCHRAEEAVARGARDALAIIAYHQPVTRAEIEDDSRRLHCRGTLDVLIETGWVRLRGRRKAPGRPVTLSARREAFLLHFGLDPSTTCPGWTS